MHQCVVCKSECHFSTDSTNDVHLFTCDRCGTYAVTYEAHVSIGGRDKLPHWWVLSARLRAASDVRQNATLTTDPKCIAWTATTVGHCLREAASLATIYVGPGINLDCYNVPG